MDVIFVSIPAAIALITGIFGVVNCDRIEKANLSLVCGIVTGVSAAVALIIGDDLLVSSAGVNILPLIFSCLFIIGAAREKNAARRWVGFSQVQWQVKISGKGLLRAAGILMIAFGLIALMLMLTPDDNTSIVTRTYVNKNITNEQLKNMVNDGRIPENVGWLELGGNKISDLTPLESLKNLQFLALDDNQISDLTPLASLTNLKQLSLSNNQISNLAPLAPLRNLQTLYLDNNQISDLTSLHALTSLKTMLSLSNNRISDLTPLASLTNLNTLLLSENQISDLTPLESLTEIKTLGLWKNRISDLTSLRLLKSLQVLALDDNQVGDLTPLASLTNLNDLELSGNQISDLTPLESLKNLKLLSVDNNPLTDEQITALLRTLPNCKLPQPGVTYSYSTTTTLPTSPP